MMRLRALAFVTLVLCVIGQTSAFVQAENSRLTNAESQPNTNDGPHIVWQDDSTAVVFYLCNDTLISRVHSVVDTLRFMGLCDDSLADYRIPRHHSVTGETVLHDVPRIFALSDVHGEYGAFTRILITAGIVTPDLRWNWGTGHLVIVGDVFDRGDRVTECLWLIYRLEQDAAAHGGGLHMLLGNHEKMVMRNDLRYVNDVYLDGIARKSRIRYNELYGPDTEMGRWLRTKPTAIVINNVLFTHAGVPPRILDERVSLTELNRAVLQYMDLSSAQTAFAEWPKYLYSGDGPLWYRGYFEEREGRYPRATEQDVDRTLALYDANAIVVGHSEAEHIMTFYNGKVVAIDVPVDELGGLEGLLWENGELYRVLVDGTRVPLKQ